MTEQEMVALLDRHVAAELAGDLETTMATMTPDPHLHNLPTMMGGAGHDGVLRFYRDHLIGQFFPPDVEMTSLSRTLGQGRIVDEVVIRFTHTTAIDWMLPGVAPSGRPVEMAVVVIAGIEDGRLAYEHIYWDQAAVLVQIGLLDPAGLPVSGAESVRRLLDPTLPPRQH